MLVSAACLWPKSELFPQFSSRWRNWSAEWVGIIGSYYVSIFAYFELQWWSENVSFGWGPCRSVLLEPQTVSYGLVRFSELGYQVQTGHLRLCISGSYVVNNVLFLEQTDRFASSWDLNISSQATVLPVRDFIYFFTLKGR